MWSFGSSDIIAYFISACPVALHHRWRKAAICIFACTFMLPSSLLNAEANITVWFGVHGWQRLISLLIMAAVSTPPLQPLSQPHGWLNSHRTGFTPVHIRSTLWDDTRDWGDVDALATVGLPCDLIWHSYHARKTYWQLTAFSTVIINYTITNECICAHGCIIHHPGGTGQDRCQSLFVAFLNLKKPHLSS